MAHFAELGENNTVLRVIVVDNKDIKDTFGVEQEEIGAAFCRNLLGGTWKQTSYNASFRKNYAGAGYTYDSERDAFIPPNPHPSWVLNEETCLWEAPTPMPQDGKFYEWDEATTSWIERTL
jgi:hypothetical protein